MSLGLHAFRRRQRALARWVLALFCLVWLQAAVVPCAMAVVPDGLGGAPEEHCSYCPPEHDGGEHHAAADAGARCTYPDHPQADTRADARPGAPALVALALPVLVVDVEPPVAGAARDVDRTRPPDRGGLPRAIAYCRPLK